MKYVVRAERSEVRGGRETVDLKLFRYVVEIPKNRIMYTDRDLETRLLNIPVLSGFSHHATADFFVKITRNLRQ